MASDIGKYLARGDRPVDLFISVRGRRNLAGQVYEQVRSAIADGRLRVNDHLPSIRELAHEVGVSRSTISLAYDRLAGEGLVRTRMGAGTYVIDRVVPRSHPTSAATAPSVRFDLGTGVAGVEHFPFATWRSLITHELRASPIERDLRSPGGAASLRAAVARYVSVSRGVPADPGDVFITSGLHHTIDLAARALLKPGGVVALEDPGYPAVGRLFKALGASVRYAAVDGEGIRVDTIPATAGLVCVAPEKQFPVGVVMSTKRRRALLASAQRSGAVLLESDHGAEFRYGGPPQVPLYAEGAPGRVVYLGSFRRLMPGLHLGFLIAPSPLHAALERAAQLTDWTPDIPTQLAAAEFIQQGHLARYARRIRGVYAERRARIADALADGLGDHLEPLWSPTGHYVTAYLRHRTDDLTIAARARSQGVAVQPLSQYAVRAGDPGLLLGYSAIPADDIEPALTIVQRILSEQR